MANRIDELLHLLFELSLLRSRLLLLDLSIDCFQLILDKAGVVQRDGHLSSQDVEHRDSIAQKSVVGQIVLRIKNSLNL